MDFFIFLLHSVISSLSLGIFLSHHQILIEASSALLMMLDSEKLMLLNLFAATGNDFSMGTWKVEYMDTSMLTNLCSNPLKFLTSFRVSWS